MHETGEDRREGRPNETLCALVLGGAPIVRAGIAYVLQREYAGRAHVFSADWQARERALAGCGKQLDLLVVYSDGEATREACLRLANSVNSAGAVVVVPPSSEMRVALLQDGVVSIPLGAPLPIWRKALQVAAKRRSRLRSQPRIIPVQAPRAPLTERQREVLEMISMGLSNKSIASRLSLSVGTVKMHVAAVLRSMQARNRLDVVLRRAAALNAQRASDDRLV